MCIAGYFLNVSFKYLFFVDEKLSHSEVVSLLIIFDFTQHTCQPRETFWRDKRGVTERSEPTSEGGSGGPPPKNKKNHRPTLQMVQSTLFLSYICEYY